MTSVGSRFSRSRAELVRSARVKQSPAQCPSSKSRMQFVRIRLSSGNDSTGPRVITPAPLSPPSPQLSLAPPAAKAPTQRPAPGSAPTPAVAAPMSSVERAKLAALERFKADQAQKEEHSPESVPSPDPLPPGKPPSKVSNKELLQGLEEEEADVRLGRSIRSNAQ